MSLVKGHYACKVKDCGKVYDYPTGLGIHMRYAHGIEGQTISAIAYRAERAAAKAAAAKAAKTKPTRSHAVATIPKAKTAAIRHPETNGFAHRIPETTLAVAFGRFTEFCNGMAYEFDLPPRMFAAELATLIARAHPPIR